MGIKETLLSFMREEAYRPMDIQELVRQARSSCDKDTFAGLFVLQQDYERDLRQLVTLKRRLLIFGILMQSVWN